MKKIIPTMDKVKVKITIEFETNADDKSVQYISQDMSVQLETLTDDHGFDVSNEDVKIQINGKDVI